MIDQIGVQALVRKNQLHLIDERSHRLHILLHIGHREISQLEECFEILWCRMTCDILTILSHIRSDASLLTCQGLIKLRLQEITQTTIHQNGFDNLQVNFILYTKERHTTLSLALQQYLIILEVCLLQDHLGTIRERHLLIAECRILCLLDNLSLSWEL